VTERIGPVFGLLIISMILLNMQVKNVIEKPHNDHLPLIEASRFVVALFCLTFFGNRCQDFVLTNLSSTNIQAYRWYLGSIIYGFEFKVCANIFIIHFTGKKPKEQII